MCVCVPQSHASNCSCDTHPAVTVLLDTKICNFPSKTLSLSHKHTHTYTLSSYYFILFGVYAASLISHSLWPQLCGHGCLLFLLGCQLGAFSGDLAHLSQDHSVILSHSSCMRPWLLLVCLYTVSSSLSVARSNPTLSTATLAWLMSAWHHVLHWASSSMDSLIWMWWVRENLVLSECSLTHSHTHLLLYIIIMYTAVCIICLYVCMYVCIVCARVCVRACVCSVHTISVLILFLLIYSSLYFLFMFSAVMVFTYMWIFFAYFTELVSPV